MELQLRIEILEAVFGFIHCNNYIVPDDAELELQIQVAGAKQHPNVLRTGGIDDRPFTHRNNP